MATQKAVITQRQMIMEAIDDVRDATIELRRKENDVLDAAQTLSVARLALEAREIEQLLGPVPVDPETTKPLTVPQREAYIKHQTSVEQSKVDHAERSLRAHQAALRIAQEECRANRTILSALASLDDE